MTCAERVSCFYASLSCQNFCLHNLLMWTTCRPLKIKLYTQVWLLACMLLVFLSLVEYAIILRRIVLHQRNIEKWRQDQIRDTKPENSTEVRLKVSNKLIFLLSSPFHLVMYFAENFPYYDYLYLNILLSAKSLA